MNTIAPEVQEQWTQLAPILTIGNEQEYDQGIARLNELLDEVGTDEAHPLYTLLDTLGIVIQAYEEEQHPMPDCSAAEVLACLMEEHQLSAVDIPELGEPDVVRRILCGQQELDIRQVRALSNRFAVSPSVFI